MRLAILTDLHANREAVEAVFEHATSQHVDRYALLGDFVGYGADPGWVVDRAREHVKRGAIAVLGNHDQAVVRGASGRGHRGVHVCSAAPGHLRDRASRGRVLGLEPRTALRVAELPVDEQLRPQLEAGQLGH